MIIGTTPDIPALQVAPPDNAHAPMRPSQHGTEFARILAGMVTSVPRNEQDAPDRHTRDTQQNSDPPPDLPSDQAGAEDDITHNLAMDSPPEWIVHEVAVAHDLPAPAITPSSEGGVDTPPSAVQPPRDMASSNTASAGVSALSLDHGRLVSHIPPEEGLHVHVKDRAKRTTQAPPLHKNARADTPPPTRIRPLITAPEFHAMPNVRAEPAFATSMINAVYAPASGPFISSDVLTHRPDTTLQFALSEGGTDPAALPSSASLTGATILTERQFLSYPKAAPVLSYPNTTPAQTSNPDTPLKAASIPLSDGHFGLPAGVNSVTHPLALPIMHDPASIPENDRHDSPVRDQSVQMADLPNLAAAEAPASHTARPTTSLLRNDATFSAAIAQAIQAATSNGDPVFELDMLDGMGGKLRISVSATDGSVQISMLAGRLDMLDMLKRSLNLLLDDLASLGFTNIDLKLAEHGGVGAMHRLQLLDTGPPDHPRKRPEQVPGASNSAGMDLRL